MNEIRTITMTATPTPNTKAAGWADTEHDSWKVTLRFQGRTMTVAFHMGVGHRRNGSPTAPSIGDVLSSLALDGSAGTTCATVEDFASEFGYDLDDPKERREHTRMFNAVVSQTSKLERLLGDYFEVLLHHAPDGGDWSEFRGDTLVFPDVEIPDDFPVRELDDDENPPGKATCGSCGRSWDDSISTAWTPVPSARCPFEGFHAEGDTA